MAEQNHNTIFGDQGTEPEEHAKDQLPEGKDLRVNDEDVPSSSTTTRRRREERPSSADDMKNPRTGPIG